MKKDELPLDIKDDYLWRQFFSFLEKEIAMFTEYVSQGVRDPVDYHKACGRIQSLKHVREKAVQLAQEVFKESEDN